MADVKLGTAYLDLEISEAQALAKAAQAGAKIAAILNSTIASALGKNDPFSALDKRLSKPIALKIDTSQAQQAIRSSVSGLEQYQKILGDIGAKKIGANISMAASIGRDTKELERQKAVYVELERHRLAMAKVQKLNIDDNQLQKVKRELNV